ncbi:4'-phosphopantetheinyl transferase superfamily protein [Chryseolinea sp. H1M3-3]|uniref:4'-phosphopantetheinyl transferase family protein n=1 Tax=Chryseolinea sp. H1M3-3 TaxID=3034144 RepID=UPI0023EC1CBC|nr:4'-phosphopantetheinyl transferase superfamily protein [Chryseolinea sp. H1M3-3]
MPLEKIVVETNRAWALWNITEDEPSLTSAIEGFEHVSDTLTNPRKRLEWLAGRVGTKQVMEALGLTFQGIMKDAFGKPFPKGYDFQLSLSHSFPYVAVLIDKNQAVGIDLEQPKEKLLKIAARVHHPSELQDLGTDIVKHCIYWCAKESLLKLYGRKDLIFAENMFIESFQRSDKGDIVGKIIIKDDVTSVPLHYVVYPNFVLVFTRSINHD